jgi:Mn-containing catalase
MFIHQKELLFPVQVTTPNPAYAAAVLEQFGGANGELKACLQYFAQSFSVQDPALRDLLLDIATEEISHLEMVGECITQLMGPPEKDPNTLGAEERKMGMEGMMMSQAPQFVQNQFLYNTTVQKSMIKTGHGLDYVDSAGSPFTGNYINNVGDLMANLQSDLAAELRARKVYEELHRHVQDKGAREMFDFLVQREEAHAQLFMEAIERAKELGELTSFGDKEYSNFYPDLSVGGLGVSHFAKSDKVITGPFSGDPDTDSFSSDSQRLQ